MRKRCPTAVIRRVTLLLLTPLACAFVAGCVAPPPPGLPEGTATVSGTLYVFHLSEGNGATQLVEVLRSGSPASPPTARPDVRNLLIARDNPKKTLSLAPLSNGCEPIAISPNGVYGACLASGTVVIFTRARPETIRHATGFHITVRAERIAGFLADDSLAIAADDLSCAAFKRSDRRYGYEPRTRLRILTTRGVLLRSGPCIHGLVTGDKKIALVGHDGNQQPQYSFDGMAWRPGLPVTFDGDDHLLVINKFDQLVDEQNQLVARDVVDAFWTR